MKTIEPVETGRLVLRPLAMSDAADLFRVYRDAEAMRFWHTPPHASVDDTTHLIGELLAGDGAWWAICLRADGVAIGTIGFHGNPGAPGMGYILGSDYWRRGYGEEALRAAATHGFRRLGFDRAELWIHQDNIASQRLAEKVGFVRRGQFRTRWPTFPHSHEIYVYGLLAREWPVTAADGRAASPVACYYLEPILGVPDVKATAEYYRDKLGFAIEFFYGDPPTHAGVSRGEWSFPAARIQLSRLESERASVPTVDLFIFVGPDIARLYDAYRNSGVEIASTLEAKPWGMREFAIRDCNGYLLRFGTPA